MEVALHPEGVDRNANIPYLAKGGILVALHPEGVDRNEQCKVLVLRKLVALHPEGVDRNSSVIF